MFLIGLSMLLFSICSVVFCVIPLFLTGTLSKDIIAYLMPFFAVLFIIGAVGIALMAVGLHQNYPERPFKQLCVKRKIKRTTVKAACSHIEETQRKVSDFLRKKGYKSITEHGENVWKCGVGFLTAMKYIKIEFEGNNTMLISGWVRVICGNEQDLKGAFVCVVPKKQVLDVITELQSCVC